MQSKTIEKYFFFGLLLATLVFTFLIFRPFWVVFVLGISFSILLYPIYEWLNKNKLPDWLASLLTVFLFIIVLCGPLLGIGAIVFKQSENVYHKVVNSESTLPLMNTINEKVNKVLPGGISFDANEKATEFVSYISHNIANIFKTTVSAFFSFILVLLIIFYCLKNGVRWKKTLILISPLAEENDEKIINRLTQAVDGVIKGSLLIALVQGILLGTGFWLFGIPNGALWGVVAAVCSLIPNIGTALVSVPAIVFLFFAGQSSSAIGLLAWSMIVVGMIDNLLSPIVVGSKTKISPILVLFSVLGGISFLGPVGILVGPLTVSLLYALISIYKNEFK